MELYYQSTAFFFEKKKQKNFYLFGGSAAAAAAKFQKAFCVSFKKEDLAFRPPLTGAPHGKGRGDRVNQRNGFRDRTWETGADTIQLRVPKLRHGSFFRAFLDPGRMAEKALTAVSQEAYV